MTTRPDGRGRAGKATYPGVRRRGNTFTAYWHDGDGRQRSNGGHPTAAAANAYREDRRTEVRAGTYSEPTDKKITVGEFLTDVWLPSIRSGDTHRATTISTYTGHVERLIPQLGHRRLLALNARHIEEALDQLHDAGGRGGKPLSWTTVGAAQTVLSMALRYGVKRGYLARNPAEHVKRRRDHQRAAKGAWTAEQGTAFLAYVRDDPWHLMWALYMTRGLRRGELAGLRWSSVDLKRERRPDGDGPGFRVESTLVMDCGKVVTSRPKTKKSRRWVPLDDVLVDALSRHHRAQLEARMAAGPRWEDTGYVFTDPDGRPLRPETISDRFNRLCDRFCDDTGAPPITLHGLRHTFTSVAYDQGYDLQLISTLLGHSGIGVTSNVYTHLFPSRTEAATTGMSAAFGLTEETG